MQLTSGLIDGAVRRGENVTPVLIFNVRQPVFQILKPFGFQTMTGVKDDVIFLITFAPQALIIAGVLYIMRQHLK